MLVQKRQTIPNDAKFLTAGHLAYSGEIGDLTRQSEHVNAGMMAKLW